MLKSLVVQNYALIDQLELTFGKGLTIITGETGAGKSVLLGALGLLLGDRSDSTALLDKTKKCIVRGEFMTNPQVKAFLEENDLDSDDELFIQREIGKDGKSRAFINDSPVNLNVLRELANLLVDIHSQHETLLLNRQDFQLSIIDAFASHEKLIGDYKARYRRYSKARQELEALKEQESRQRAEQDYLLFQYNEISDADLLEGEKESLEEELNALTHSEEIRSALLSFEEIMNGDRSGLRNSVASALSQLNAVARYMPSLEPQIRRLQEAQIEIKDIEEEVLRLGEEVQVNPGRIDQINERLQVIYRLEHKHQVRSVQELIQLGKSMKEKLDSFSSLGERIINLDKDLQEAMSSLEVKADKLTAGRTKAIPIVETRIRKMLADLAMPDAQLKVEMTSLPDQGLTESGQEMVKFMFSANKGVLPAELNKIASGGELSRLMLCLKAAVAKLMELPTIVFDEIDSGVSGETAYKIGNVMKELAQSHQLLAITHLPQIASRGQDHYFVYKEAVGKKTVTRVKKLTTDERVVEVARMLSGDRPTAVSMENARELLGN